MSQTVRWAILGAGKIAHSFAKDIISVPNAQLVAVASSDPNRAQNFASEYHIPLVFNYDQLYRSAEVDAVYIATTNNFHFEQVLQCINHAKHVLCEKPITINDEQFKQLVSSAADHRIFLMEAMWTYFLPAVLAAQKWVNEGRIGALRVIEACFGYPMEKNPEGRLFNINLAGGALLDLGVYPVAFATYFTNDEVPQTIAASAALTETGVDGRTGISLQYKNISASLFASMNNIMSNKAMLYGEKGYIELPDFFKASSARLYDDHHKLIDEFHDQRTTKGYNFEIEHATNLILEGKIESNVVTHSRSNRTQEIMTEVRRQIGLRYPGE